VVGGDDKPSLFTAVQEQLGLRLEPATDAVDAFIVDSVEPPTPNWPSDGRLTRDALYLNRNRGRQPRERAPDLRSGCTKLGSGCTYPGSSCAERGERID
jgi:hypothetical protein